MSSYGPVTNTGVVTSYLPLTTAWPFSAGCSTQILSVNVPGVSAPVDIFFNDPKFPNVVPQQPTCLPPQISTWWYQTPQESITTLLGGYTFLCPSAYSTVYSSAGTTTGSVTTTIGCCPTAYSFVSLRSAGTVNQCISTVVPQDLTFAIAVSESLYTFTSTSITATALIAGVQINGYIFPNPATTSSTTSTPSTPSTSSTSSNPAGNTSSPSITLSNIGSSGLSTGAKAGIGVGAVGVVIALVALGAAALLFRRKRRAENAAPVNHPEYYEEKREPVEVGRSPMHEMEAPGYTRELPGASNYTHPAELVS